ncbi:CU044_5270 family protein [Spirillospora sp. NBC_01491]|uniref:CU044_5270 family protein n=1 Tax=Spirillospora sp. NBC_01491 TaxID=2976007 RepID=UPI002E3429EA|nr:CU044_5270 family protein [Spirillospora sp. NBC_01491]
MNDLNEVRELWSEAAEPSAARLAAVRERLLEETRSGEQPDGVRVRRPRRVWAIRTAVAGTLVAAATAGVVVLPSGDGPGPAPANAAELLTRAAAAAGDGRDIEPRPGQFVYQESTALELATGNDNDTAPWFRKVRYQQWQRADGAVPVYRRTTLLGVVPLRGGKVSSRTMQLARIDTGGRFLPCASQPTEPNAPYAAHAKLPTDPAPLRSALAARVDAGQRAELTQDQAVWVNLTGLVSAPTPSKVQAALFTVARQIKGARLSGGTTDAAGRPGLAVTFDARPGEREDLIFDAKTYRLLGHRSVWTGAGDTPPSGTTTGDVAVTKTSVVDSLPAGVSTSGHTCPAASGG